MGDVLNGPQKGLKERKIIKIHRNCMQFSLKFVMKILKILEIKFQLRITKVKDNCQLTSEFNRYFGHHLKFIPVYCASY